MDPSLADTASAGSLGVSDELRRAIATLATTSGRCSPAACCLPLPPPPVVPPPPSLEAVALPLCAAPVRCPCCNRVLGSKVSSRPSDSLSYHPTCVHGTHLALPPQRLPADLRSIEAAARRPGGGHLSVRSINHISKVCSNVAASAAFYRDVLGFIVIKRPSQFDESFEGCW